jgi:predicted homoserine dehydrogenase-like protein
LRREATGVATCWNADVVATAKRDLQAGEVLDGEGGYTVWGKLMPARKSLAAGALPIGLAHRVKLKNDVAHGAVVRWSDVEVDENSDTIKTRRAMEAAFSAR